MGQPTQQQSQTQKELGKKLDKPFMYYMSKHKNQIKSNQTIIADRTRSKFEM